MYTEGKGFFQELYITPSGGISYQDYSVYAHWLENASIITFTASLLASVLSFYNDKDRRRIFWKVFFFLIPILGVIIIIGYNTKFCLMMSCSDFGEQGVLVAIFSLPVFIFAMSWPVLIKDGFKRVKIRWSLCMAILFVFISYIGVWYASEKLQDHEREISSYERLGSKQASTEWCKRGIYSTTEDICFLNQAIKRHDESLCSEISTTEISSYCASQVECSSFHPVYKSWTTDNNECKALKP